MTIQHSVHSEQHEGPNQRGSSTTRSNMYIDVLERLI